MNLYTFMDQWMRTWPQIVWDAWADVWWPANQERKEPHNATN